MDDLILIKSGALGTRGTMPALQTNEMGYCTDKRELCIGTVSGNIRLCGADDVERIAELENRITEITARLEALEASDE